jgi:hypothetical protein
MCDHVQSSYHVAATTYLTPSRVYCQTYYTLVMQAIVQWGFLQDYYRNLVFGQVQWKSLIGAAISEAHGVLGLVYERGLRQGSVRAEAKR